jgi:acetate kinase
MIAKKLEFAGVEFDDFQNLFRWEIRTISTRYSPVRLIVIPTDEEWMMAKEAKKFID